MGDIYLVVVFRVTVVADYYKAEQYSAAENEQQVRSYKRGQTAAQRSSRLSYGNWEVTPQSHSLKVRQWNWKDRKRLAPILVANCMGRGNFEN